MKQSPMYQLLGVRKYRTQGGSAFELQIPQLEIRAGELVAVVGESGCGKSTLLDLLALVMRPTESNSFRFTDPRSRQTIDAAALWHDQREDELAKLRRNYMGYVIQTGGLLPFLSVRANIELSARISGNESAPVEQISSDLGIVGCLDRMPSALSVGQRQRVAIARAVAHGPALILADEPTAAVDQGRAAQIMEGLALLARQHHAAVVVVTHDRPLVVPLMDRGYGFSVTAETEELTVSVCHSLDSMS